MAQDTLTVIIPTLDEEESLGLLLGDLAGQQGIALELIITDGGSTDGTEQVAARHSALWIQGAKGRGAQLNRGACLATHEYLLFLHADSRIKDAFLLCNALHCLRAESSREGHHRIAGHFPLHFQRRSNDHSVAYRYLEEKSSLNREYTTNGDQGFLMHRDLYHEMDGFDPSLPFLEDQKLAEKIRARGKWRTLPGVLHTSARRFEEEGFYRRYILMAVIMGCHLAPLPTFFQRAPHVYVVQKETGRLMMWPYFALLWDIMVKELGLSGILRIWYMVGLVVCRSGWQPFFFLDVLIRPLTGQDRCPFLRLFDICLRPVTRTSICGGIAGIFAFFWCMVCLPAWFWLTEFRARAGK